MSRETNKERADSDLKLLRRYQRGEQEAFDELVIRYYGRATRIALSYVKEAALAEDVAQEAFFKVHRYASQFQGQSSFSTWLYRIVVNLCIDHIRKYRRAPLEQPMNGQDSMQRIDETDTAGFLPRDLGGNPSDYTDKRELAAKLLAALDDLPDIHRSVIVLREIEELSYEEIARSLKIRKGTVMSRLFHARRALADNLAEYLEVSHTSTNQRGQP